MAVAFAMKAIKESGLPVKSCVPYYRNRRRKWFHEMPEELSGKEPAPGADFRRMGNFQLSMRKRDP